MTPLTHHDILTLAAPFSRRDRHVDLQGSNRRERRIAFKPVVHPGPSDGEGAITEHLVLENPEDAQFRLTRTLTHSSGLTAVLRVDGENPDRLAEQITGISPHWQFAQTPSLTIAYSYRIAPEPLQSRVKTLGNRPFLTEVLARSGAALVRFDFDPERGSRIPIQIRADDADIEYLPKDFFTVLGSAWHRLRHEADGWQGNLYAYRREPRRTRDGERKATRTIAHLVQTLAQSPSQFHPQNARARWIATLRGILTMLGLYAAMAVAPLIVALAPDNVILTTLAYFWYPALLVGLILFSARLELAPPTWPRQVPDTAWRPSGSVTTARAQEEVVRSILASRVQNRSIQPQPTRLQSQSG